MADEATFEWDGVSPYFYAGEALVPAIVEDLSKDGGRGWCGTVPLGESGVLLDLYVDPDSPDDNPESMGNWVILASPMLEDRFGHSLRFTITCQHDRLDGRLVGRLDRLPKADSCDWVVVVSEWGDTPAERLTNQVFHGWSPPVTVHDYLEIRKRLMGAQVHIDEDVTFWRPGEATG